MSKYLQCIVVLPTCVNCERNATDLDSSLDGNRPDRLLAVVQYPDRYVQPLITDALRRVTGGKFEVVEHDMATLDTSQPCVLFKAYEDLDFESAMNHSRSMLLCAYAIRKALIRKHYLSNTIASWLVKHPASSLQRHFKPSVHFELDYAEFLDEALVDAWDFHESMSRNGQNLGDKSKEWWILKPGMSDGGNGIRLFSSLQQLQSIFEEWDPPSDDEAEVEVDSNEASEAISKSDERLMTSHLRHFVAQPYIDPPLLLSTYDNRKFHIRCYVLAVGALKVFVYREMLALFAAKSYESPSRNGGAADIDLSQHLTNTCFHEETTKGSAVHRFWALDDAKQKAGWQADVFSDICETIGEVFEAAAREQMVHFQTLPNAFEAFGVDFLVDANYNVWLLEMNAYPDFKQTGEGLQSKVVGGFFEGVIRHAVAPFFKVATAGDTDDQMVLVREVNLGRR